MKEVREEGSKEERKKSRRKRNKEGKKEGMGREEWKEYKERGVTELNQAD